MSTPYLEGALILLLIAAGITLFVRRRTLGSSTPLVAGALLLGDWVLRPAPVAGSVADLVLAAVYLAVFSILAWQGLREAGRAMHWFLTRGRPKHAKEMRTEPRARSSEREG